MQSDKDTTSKIYNKLQDYIKKGNIELFLFESPANNYKPAPTEGYFAMRSNKRRIFMNLDNGHIPHPDEIQRRIDSKQYTELLISESKTS